jgi:outer membrane protein assembly factor BamA
VQRRLTQAITLNGRYSFSTTRIFDLRVTDEEDLALIDRAFPQVRLSGFSGAVSRDTRDELLNPQRGSFLSAEGSMAARSLGGQVGFIKTYLQGFWFHRLPGRRAVVFATRAAVGLADGFPREVTSTDEEGNPVGSSPAGTTRSAGMRSTASARRTRLRRPASRPAATP